MLALGGPQPAALAIPQTSACATEPCDGQDLSNKDLRQEFYTKGSLKGANFSNSNLSGVTLFGADLTNANMEGSLLYAVSVRGARAQRYHRIQHMRSK